MRSTGIHQLLYMIIYTQIILGGVEYIGDHHDWILKFDKTSLQWTEVGKMSQTRYYHAMSVVNVGDILDYCT